VPAVNVATDGEGSLWYTTGGKWVGRMAADGRTSTVSESSELRGTFGITRGPDGAMWVTNYLGSSIARVDSAGNVRGFRARCLRYPTGITTGPDGALWFGDDAGRIGRITIDGRIACFGDASRVGHPRAIVAGRDGALWAADRGGSIVRITTRGVVTRSATAAMRFPSGIDVARDGSVWFTDYGADAVGRVDPRFRSVTRPLRRAQATVISDSVAASIAFDIGAMSILQGRLDLFFEPGQARTLGPGPPDGIAPPTVLDLVTQLGRRLGRTVLVQIGDNDYCETYAENMQAALGALRAAGVERVLWATLRVTPDHASYAVMNDAILAASGRHPELTVLDWNAHAATHPEWFQADGVHLTGEGPRALARFLHAGIVRATQGAA
jgi:streptogramin lyase